MAACESEWCVGVWVCRGEVDMLGERCTGECAPLVAPPGCVHMLQYRVLTTGAAGLGSVGCTGAMVCWGEG